jgi:hypothetical protein
VFSRAVAQYIRLASAWEVFGRRVAQYIWHAVERPRLLAAQPAERDPPEDQLEAAVRACGFDAMPEWPGERLPSGDPVPGNWTPRAADVARAQSTKWREDAADFHDYNPRLMLADPPCALAEKTAARRLRLQRACATWPDEVEAKLSAVPPLFRELWDTPRGRPARRLADRRAHPADYFWRHSWEAYVVLEVELLEAHVAYVQRLCRHPPIRARTAAALQHHAVGAVAARVYDHLAVYLAIDDPDAKPRWKDVRLVMRFYGWSVRAVWGRKLEQRARRYRQRVEEALGKRPHATLTPGFGATP